MKRFFASLVLIAFSPLALATATVTSATGGPLVQTAGGTTKPLRVGDSVNVSDTVVTGSGASAVVKFDDGQVAALTAGSRLEVNTFSYDPAAKTGSLFLTVARGGVRFVTGEIGKNSRQDYGIRVGQATVRVLGTDFTIVVTSGGTVHAQVNQGVITFEYGGKTVKVETGQAALTNPNGTVSQGTIAQIFAQLQNTATGQEIAAVIGGIGGLTVAINQAFPGTPAGASGEGSPAGAAAGFGTASGFGTSRAAGSGGGGGPPASPS